MCSFYFLGLLEVFIYMEKKTSLKSTSQHEAKRQDWRDRKIFQFSDIPREFGHPAPYRITAHSSSGQQKKIPIPPAYTRVGDELGGVTASFENPSGHDGDINFFQNVIFMNLVTKRGSSDICHFNWSQATDLWNVTSIIIVNHQWSWARLICHPCFLIWKNIETKQLYLSILVFPLLLSLSLIYNLSLLDFLNKWFFHHLARALRKWNQPYKDLLMIETTW